MIPGSTERMQKNPNLSRVCGGDPGVDYYLDTSLEFVPRMRG